MAKQTHELEHELLHSSDIRLYFENNDTEFINPSLSDYLNQLLIENHMTKADIAKASGLEQHYLYQIFSGLRRPSRDKVLAIAFGFHLTLEQTQDLLKKAEYPVLYTRIKRDAYIMHCFHKHFTLDEANAFLEVQNESQLFSVE